MKLFAFSATDITKAWEPEAEAPQFDQQPLPAHARAKIGLVTALSRASQRAGKSPAGFLGETYGYTSPHIQPAHQAMLDTLSPRETAQLLHAVETLHQHVSGPALERVHAGLQQMQDGLHGPLQPGGSVGGSEHVRGLVRAAQLPGDTYNPGSPATGAHRMLTTPFFQEDHSARRAAGAHVALSGRFHVQRPPSSASVPSTPAAALGAHQREAVLSPGEK